MPEVRWMIKTSYKPVIKSLCKSHHCIAQRIAQELLFDKYAFTPFQNYIRLCLSLSFQNGWLASGLTFWCYATSMMWRTLCSFTTWPLVLSSSPSRSRSAASWGTAARRRTPRSSISLLPFYLQVRVFLPMWFSLKIRLIFIWVSFGTWKYNAIWKPHMLYYSQN